VWTSEGINPETQKQKNKMKTDRSSAEYATNLSPRHGKAGITAHLMLQQIGDIRHDMAHLASYLSHPEITTGLASGRFGRKGLVRRLTEMHAADC
jgi:hypothetical protein